MSGKPQPSMEMVRSATAWAALAATFPILMFGPFFVFILPGAIGLALAHAILLGLPIYLLLRHRFALSRVNAVVAGFLIGWTPVTILSCFAYLRGYSLSEGLGDWWVGIWRAALLFGVCGAVGGFAFVRAIEMRARARRA